MYFRNAKSNIMIIILIGNDGCGKTTISNLLKLRGYIVLERNDQSNSEYSIKLNQIDELIFSPSLDIRIGKTLQNGKKLCSKKK